MADLRAFHRWRALLVVARGCSRLGRCTCCLPLWFPVAEQPARGLAATPWPAEDGGPQRLQQPRGLVGPGAGAGTLVATRTDPIAVMAVLAPGSAGAEPYRLLLLRNSVGPEGVSWVEELDPDGLEPRRRSQDLDLGPYWPGGLAVLDDGAVVVVQGRFVHRLDANLRVEASRCMEVDAPHNSFVVLSDGSLALKDLQFPDGTPSVLSVLDPVTLGDRCAPYTLGEPSVARLAAAGMTVAVVGVDALHRIGADTVGGVCSPLAAPLRYRTNPDQSYGWDPVVTEDAVWWLDNGAHTFPQGLTMLGNAVSAGPVRLWRAQGEVLSSVEVSGVAAGAVTNPPLVDTGRELVIGYDSANGVMAAFDMATLALRWRTRLRTATHLVLHPDTGEVIANDHDPDSGDALVVVGIEEGEVRVRVPVASPAQSVVFGCPGWRRDHYFVSLSTIARVQFSGGPTAPTGLPQ